MRITTIVLAAVLLAPLSIAAQGANPLASEIDRLTAVALPDVVRWRRDFHQHPELGNRETRTAGVIAEELRKLGYEVKTNVAHTGVVAVLRGGKPGPVVALRSDMDGLPVSEQVDVPFKSAEKAMWGGQQVGVMHACGHDNHMAILLGAASVLAKLKAQIPGTVKLIFQPAEEGAPDGEEGGAALMIKEGVLQSPKVDVVFGLHVFPLRAGTIEYRAGPLMASTDTFTIKVKGRQTHGAVPWGGVDPIVIGSQIVLSLQTVISRSTNITTAPAVVTVGQFNGGVRTNIVPADAQLAGTIRAFDESVRQDIQRRIRDIATHTAQGMGGDAEVTITPGYPVTVNDPVLTERMAPTLRRVAGADNVHIAPMTGTGEDFSYYEQQVAGLFFFLGVTPLDKDPAAAAQNHSPLFFADESALPVGVRALTNLTLDYMFSNPKTGPSAQR